MKRKLVIIFKIKGETIESYKSLLTDIFTVSHQKILDSQPPAIFSLY